MPRATDGTRRHDRRRKILKSAKGYRGKKSKLFRTAKDAVAKAGQYAYRDRRAKKRDFRGLWIARISAAARSEGITYSQLIHGLAKAQVQVNRKALSNLAIEDSKAFSALIGEAKKALGR